MQRGSNPTVGTTAQQAIISARIFARGHTRDEAQSLLDATAAEIRSRLGSIVFGEDVCDLWSKVHPKTVTRGVVGWVGSNEAARKQDRQLQLYVSMWKNPHPDKKVVSIDYISTNTDAAPVCVAMTVEAAPDTSTDEAASDSPSQ